MRTLLARARDHNASVGISGMLLHQRGTFLQVLEGEAVEVTKIYDKIHRDPRHGHVVLLTQSDVVERNFADWSMGFVDVRGSASRLPGFRAVGSLAGLVDHRAIEKVVTSFRDGRWRQQNAA